MLKRAKPNTRAPKKLRTTANSYYHYSLLIPSTQEHLLCKRTFHDGDQGLHTMPLLLPPHSLLRGNRLQWQRQLCCSFEHRLRNSESKISSGHEPVPRKPCQLPASCRTTSPNSQPSVFIDVVFDYYCYYDYNDDSSICTRLNLRLRWKKFAFGKIKHETKTSLKLHFQCFVIYLKVVQIGSGTTKHSALEGWSSHNCWTSTRACPDAQEIQTVTLLTWKRLSSNAFSISILTSHPTLTQECLRSIESTELALEQVNEPQQY